MGAKFMLAENRRQTLDDYLHMHKQEAQVKGYLAWMKENHSDVEPMKVFYFYARRAKLYPLSAPKKEKKEEKPLGEKMAAMPMNKASKPKVKRHPKKHIKKMKPVVAKKHGPSNLIDLTELRQKLADHGVSIEEHKLIHDTMEKMELLDPSLSDFHVWKTPDGKIGFELTRVKVVSFVG